jgi:hypothetical protein
LDRENALLVFLVPFLVAFSTFLITLAAGMHGAEGYAGDARARKEAAAWRTSLGLSAIAGLITGGGTICWLYRE